MTAPRTVKEVQSLTGKLAALTRFLSKADKRQLPFFKTLKGCLKQKSFVWSSEAETAFQEMKKLLKNLPTLIAPVDGEILYLYISVANEAFGSVLIAERHKIQKPVYFVSKALTGSEINYEPIEKFVYALILTSRRLRRYFQGHPVHVLTNLPIKQVLTKPEISGRLALWVVELGAYQISYLPRSAVKGQVMADYLAKMSGELDVINERTALKPVIGETWNLFTDGASCMEGAEYEAILAGLNIARKMDITKLRAFTDSQLKYLQLLRESTGRFEQFELSQLPRSLNKKADALSKLAALTFSHFQKQVWVEELSSKSLDNDLMVPSVEEEHPNWMEPILQYIRNDTLPRPGNVKFLNVTVDYFTKWVKVRHFALSLECRYETLCGIALSADLAFREIAHPQANGLCEVTNRDIVSGIKKRLCEKRTGWVDELPNVLWAHRTTFKKSTGETPFSLVYGSEAVILAEILVPTHRIANFEEEANDAALSKNLNFIKERRLMVAIREANNKQQIANYSNKRVRALSFDIGEWVLRNNEASRAEKLEFR
ncbi:uncharacterized protein [Rutidosis leptorrhynchoides]|uniref:uncharacterized protein n=1 Tax=Rutidosis leptorrhynchoides TaxID=125765 RepID=UPI003A99639B